MPTPKYTENPRDKSSLKQNHAYLLQNLYFRPFSLNVAYLLKPLYFRHFKNKNITTCLPSEKCV